MDREFIISWTRDRQVFQTQVHVGMVKVGGAVFSERVVLDIGVKNRLAFDTTKFNRESMLPFRVASDQREQPEDRQRGPKIADQKAVEKSHQTEFAAFLFTHIVTQSSE